MTKTDTLKPATTTIAEIRNGGLSEEIAEKLRELVNAVRATAKPGKLTITLDVEPVGNHAGDVLQIIIEDDVAVKLPKPAKRNTAFFPSESGDLMRQQTIGEVEPRR